MQRTEDVIRILKYFLAQQVNNRVSITTHLTKLMISLLTDDIHKVPIGPIEERKHRNNKLTDQQVKEIRTQLIGKHGEIRTLAKKYNVHVNTISAIKSGKTW